jgi:hypothetical protein
MFVLTDDEALTVALTLDDWLEVSSEGDDEISRSRYAEVVRIRNAMAGLIASEETTANAG